MNLFDFNYTQFQEFILVFFRIGSIVVSSPILGNQNTPMQVKIGLIFFLTLSSFSIVDVHLPVSEHNSIIELAPLLFSEMMIGVCVGFASHVIFAAAKLAGQVIGFQMGFAIVNVMDPVSNTQISITSQSLNIFALLVFLAVDAHHWYIQGILYSFQAISPGGFTLTGGLLETLVQMTSAIFVVALQLAAPVLAVLFFLQVGLGVLARTVPQMNIFVVGLPLQILLGLLMMSLILPIAYTILSREFNQLGFTIVQILKLM
ncbi:MAG: flagellar type III secretion system protein FliR [Nitrospinae bacterium]|nr:flagellar type III secretion system protein FliR [Nitrospinota bacterium]